jgi:hypothetical protein
MRPLDLIWALRGSLVFAGGEYESFRVSIRAWASGRDLHCFDTDAGQDCVEGLGELPGPVADQESEICGAIILIVLVCGALWLIASASPRTTSARPRPTADPRDGHRASRALSRSSTAPTPAQVAYACPSPRFSTSQPARLSSPANRQAKRPAKRVISVRAHGGAGSCRRPTAASRNCRSRDCRW